MSAPPVDARDRAVYVHFPYCASKCPYCDFNSHVVDHDDAEYADAILTELDARQGDLPPPEPSRPALTSLFFGGGTPSRWAPSAVGRVLDGVRRTLGAGPELEVSLEANPGSVDAGRFRALVEAGVGRISIGCQSFDDAELAWLGRRHDARSGRRAVEAAQAAGARVSLDVMYGLPGQDWPAVRRTLEQAVDLGTEHLSAYALTVEPGTLLARRARLKQFRPTDEDHLADLYLRVTGFLAERGFARYEVSNYARPGAECRHNVAYWQGTAYLGLGAGAHGYRPGRGDAPSERRANLDSPRAYLDTVAQGDFAPRFTEALDLWDRTRDRLLVACRTRWGIALGDLALPPEVEAQLGPELATTGARLEREGLLQRSEGRFLPTPRGFAFADTIARAWLDAVDAARGGA